MRPHVRQNTSTLLCAEEQLSGFHLCRRRLVRPYKRTRNNKHKIIIITGGGDGRARDFGAAAAVVVRLPEIYSPRGARFKGVEKKLPSVFFPTRRTVFNGTPYGRRSGDVRFDPVGASRKHRSRLNRSGPCRKNGRKSRPDVGAYTFANAHYEDRR